MKIRLRVLLVVLVLGTSLTACAPPPAAAEPGPTPTAQAAAASSVPSPIQPAKPAVQTATAASAPTLPAILPTPTSEPGPSPTPQNAGSPRTTLLFTGVIVPARCVQAALDERGSPDYPYDEVRGLIQNADLAVGTINATMSHAAPRTGCRFTYVLVGDPQNADAMQRAGFDLMSVATNHIKNCGLANCGDRAFFDTLDNLRRVGILPVGAGANHADAMQPVVVELNGVRFGFVSLGQIEPLAFAGPETPGIAVLTPENLRAAIQAARAVSDLVIALPHWGPEDAARPTYPQRDLAQKAVEYGADLVVGNHTHVVQGLQTINNIPVFYGLGNFIFDQDLNDHQQGAVLLVHFQGKQYDGFDLVPTHVDQDGTVHIARPQEAAEVLERMRQASLGLANQPQDLNSWTPQYHASLPSAELQTLSAEEQARRLFEQWLDYAQFGGLPREQRITSYEIVNVSSDANLRHSALLFDADVLLNVTFSVRPAILKYSHWAAGNGEIGADGWIRSKSLYVGLRQVGDRTWLVILGTGL